MRLTIIISRPVATRADGIGMWMPVMEFMGVAGVLTNGAVIAFSGEFVDRAVYQYDNAGFVASLNFRTMFSIMPSLFRSLAGYIAKTHPASPSNASCQYEG